MLTVAYLVSCYHLALAARPAKSSAVHTHTHTPDLLLRARVFSVCVCVCVCARALTREAGKRAELP